MTSDDIHAYIKRLEVDITRKDRTIENLLEQLEAKTESQNLDLLLDAVGTMAELYRVRFDTLPGNTQAVIRAYDRYLGSGETSQSVKKATQERA